MANRKPTAPPEDLERGRVALEVLAAVNEALEAAIDLSRPRHTTARALSVQATLSVALRHPARAGWAAGRLRQLAAEWRQS